jgi:RNA-directed DNA polymerase
MQEKRRENSKLYGVISPNLLCYHLNIKPKELDEIADVSGRYKVWQDNKSGRWIQEPKENLKSIHCAIARLLAAIETPDYLHSAKKGFSYLSNAQLHPSDQPTVKIDVKSFYGAVRAQAVFHFFFDRMKCARDVAGVLTKILTFNGHLPTGSSASPILSYFAYEDMFLDLWQLGQNSGCIMTVYVDDIIFTGTGANRHLLNEAKKIMSAYKLKGHKQKRFFANQPKILTGVVRTPLGSKLPNKRQKNIRLQTKIVGQTACRERRLIEAKRLLSYLQEAAQVDSKTWCDRVKQIKNEIIELRSP